MNIKRYIIKWWLNSQPQTQKNTSLFFKYVFNNKDRRAICDLIILYLEQLSKPQTAFLCPRFTNKIIAYCIQKKLLYGLMLWAPLLSDQGYEPELAYIQLFFPEFTKRNAIIVALEDENELSDIWWESSDIESRIIFVRWIKSHYLN